MTAIYEGFGTIGYLTKHCKVCCIVFEVFVTRASQRATKLPVLSQPFLLQVMYMTFQYLIVSCIPAV